jgi:beta-N-acetylhexosaminidase
MSRSAARLFGVGLAGPSLDPSERAILERLPPRTVILFKRNIETERQLADLCGEIRSLSGEPVLCLDQEGGRVDRLREIAGPFPSFHEAARAGFARRAGELAAEACARFGFRVDLAPVVDRRVPGAGEAVLGDRAAAEEPDRVIAAARDFLEGLHSRGVAGCLKHFPGLGRARRDTHLALPVLAADEGGEEKDLAPFRALHELAGAVMVSHAASPQDARPASLSRDVATRLLRDAVGFEGVTLSDDLEMGALAEFGGLPERSEAAMLAGCDLLFVCLRLEEYPDCVARVASEVPEERRAEASRRIDRYVDRLRALEPAPLPARSLEAIAADVALLREAAGTGPAGLHPPPYWDR